MKIAITGASSGIGHELDIYISLTTDHEVRGFSKSNGYNIATNNGEDVVQSILEYDPDVVFNNAYYPKAQNNILSRLYDEWKDQKKVIINTGSISGYLKGILLDDDSDYVNDKKELAEFCIRNSFNYPWNNKTRIHNVSFGFVETPLLTNTNKDINKNNLLSALDAVEILYNLIEEKPYYIAEQVINCTFDSDDEMFLHFGVATRNMLKHIARSNKK
jgi:hypothetical protein